MAFEFSYDKFHADADRIYRVVSSAADEAGTQHNEVMMSAPLGPALRQETSGFSAVSTLFTDDTRVLIPLAGKPARVIPGISGDQTHHITFADTDYLKIFHYQWLAGNPATALQKPFSVVLTESEAKQYFQGGTPQEWMGRSVVYEDSLTVSVYGDRHSATGTTIPAIGFKDLISAIGPSIDSFLSGTYIQSWEMSGAI